jgi:tetratricopeptide (TPR) repeat protein
MSLGEIESAEKNIHKAEETRPSVAITLLGMGLIEYSKSSLLLIKGQYKDALDMILIDINKSNHHKFDKKVLLPEYIAQAQILNYMTNYTDAYEIINTNVYQHLKNKNKDEISPILLARTLIELSRSELGLNKTTEAFNHAEEAVNILKEEEARNNRDIDNSRDVYVAPALVAKGDALASLGKTEESLNDYKLAKNIYWNIYGTKNIGKMDNVSYLLASGAKAARKLPNKIDAQIECDYFYKLLIKFFGNNHPRSIEINGVCNY